MLDPISSLLLQEIHHHGPLRFDRFMEIALYQPEIGYYSSGETRTGRQGDFLTPVSPGPLLGQLIALQITEIHQALNHPPTLHLVEQGADRGHLAHDILTALSQHHPDLLPTLHLHLIEPSPSLARQQKTHLDLFRSSLPLHWHAGLSFLPLQSHPTFFYSCELIDSFPVRLIRFSSGQWHERLVTQTANNLNWVDQPVSAELLNEINRWSIPPIEGFTTEIRPGVSSWFKLLSEKIHQGAILTLDYGFPAHELYHPSRFAGTLHALRQHAPSANPLTDPGQQDLTAHVNFSELIEEGKKLGFHSHGPLPFMTALPRQATPILRNNPPMSEKSTRNFQHLIHPSFFGQSHLALLQTKNLPESYQPSMFFS
jgi:SAM-dependent MidA family methyltransferase